MLEQEIGQIEEELWEQNPVLQEELQQARTEFAAGNYLSIEQYIRQSDKDA